MNRKTIFRIVAFLGAVSTLSGCASYVVRPMPKLNPVSYINHSQYRNFYIAAKAYRTKSECEAVFSDNLVGAGYMPVQVALKNMGRNPLILYRQDFVLKILVDGKGHKGLLPIDPSIVAQHFKNSTAKGAFLGGVFGYAAAEHANHKRETAFKHKGLRRTIPLASGQVVEGFLYYKGNVKASLPALLQLSFTHNTHNDMTSVELH